MRNNNKPSFMPKLLFLCIITTSIVTTFSLSKYQSTLTGSTGNSSVAIPLLNVALAENQQKKLEIDCNTDNTSVNYEIVVNNKENNIVSEVSLKYDIIITLPSSAPNGLTIKVDNKSTTKSGNTYKISNIGQFTSGTQNENTHTLTFEADPDIIRNCSFKDATITVYAEQID